MIDYIKGTVAELTPTVAVLETNGVGMRSISRLLIMPNLMVRQVRMW